MVIYHKAVTEGYIKDVCFDKTSITKILDLNNLIQQYRVTYDSLDQILLFIEKGKKQCQHAL